MNGPFLYGVAFTFNEWSRPIQKDDGTKLILKVLPGATKDMDVSKTYACISHDSKTAFAGPLGGDVGLRLLPYGVMFRLLLPNQIQKSVKSLIDRGALAGASASIKYFLDDCSDTKQSQYTYRIIRKLSCLKEISLARSPMWPDTRIAMMGDDPQLQKQFYSGKVLL